MEQEPMDLSVKVKVPWNQRPKIEPELVSWDSTIAELRKARIVKEVNNGFITRLKLIFCERSELRIFGTVILQYE